jgi:hypothetical protein
MHDTGTIHDASRAAATAPRSIEVELSGGRRRTVRRLNWLQFSALWPAVAALISELTAGGGDNTEASGTGERLSGIPAFLSRLAVLAGDIDERELDGFDLDDVLAVAAAALELNFVSGAGVRRFFGAASHLVAELARELTD